MSLEEEKNSSCAEGQEIQTPDTKAIETPPNENMAELISQDNESTEIKDLPQGADNKELYQEVLDKLDIQKKDTQDNQEKSMQDKSKQQALLNKLKSLEQAATKQQLEKAITQDLAKIQGLMKAGLINSSQGQNLKKQVLKKAFDKLVQAEKTKRNLLPALQNGVAPIGNAQKSNSLEEFARSNSEFFNSDGRKEVLNYLKSGNVSVGKDELNRISEIVRLVEKSAIDRYLQKVTHEKTLQDSNESAKRKLTANAQNSGHVGNLLKSFTREQIGKMSSAEFSKYEPYIMEQLKKGLIK